MSDQIPLKKRGDALGEFEAGDVVPVEFGGTGANNAVDARANLGLANVAATGQYADLLGKPTLFSGSYDDLTDKPSIPSSPGDIGAQPANDNLTGIAGLALAADQGIYYGSAGWVTYSLTTVGRTFLAATTQAAQRAAIQAVGLSGNETIAGTKTFTSTVQIDANIQILGGSAGASRLLRIGSGRTVDGASYFDLVSDTIVSDYNFRFYRQAGTNGDTNLNHRGTGSFVINGENGGPILIRSSGSNRLSVFGDRIQAAVDIIPATNAISLGGAGHPFANLYVTNPPITSSDARLKTDPADMSPAEVAAFAQIARMPNVWKWLAGDRIHGGPTVQGAMAIMESHGLDPFAYACFCHDQWDAQPEQWSEWEAESDDDGNVIMEAGRELVQAAREAGDLYSFRKEELLCFMVAAQARQHDELEARVAALEARG